MPGSIKADDDDTEELSADVLVIGGGPAGAWAAATAVSAGSRVVLVDKGFLGTSGATAAANTAVIDVPPDSASREAVIRRRLDQGCGLADAEWIAKVVDETHRSIGLLAEWGYVFPRDDRGRLYRGALRGPDYMRVMRRRLTRLGVRVLDQSPAFELLTSEGVVAGAAGLHRVSGARWKVNAGAVIIATGGCAFLSKALGTYGLTGDGLLMAAEAGAELSDMEFSGQYGISHAAASVTKNIIYSWATFTDASGQILDGEDPFTVIAENLLKGPVYAFIDNASPAVENALRRGQPNVFLPLDRQGIDPFRERFHVTLRYEGTVRGVGGLAVDTACATNIAGLFAAGDAASRGQFVGATSGGGGPNATWAIASGVWSGRSAARFAAHVGSSFAKRRARGIGRVGLRSTELSKGDLSLAEIVSAVKREILPIDRSFFRSRENLSNASSRLDSLWGKVQGTPHGARSREVAALIAVGRLITSSATIREETRGIQRRVDFRETDRRLEHHLICGGLENVWVRSTNPPAGLS